MAKRASDSGTARKRPINPPPKEEPCDRDQWDQHGVLHQGMHVVPSPAGSHFVHAEADMDQEHQRNSNKVVKLSEYCCNRSNIRIHRLPSVIRFQSCFIHQPRCKSMIVIIRVLTDTFSRGRKHPPVEFNICQCIEESVANAAWKPHGKRTRGRW